MKSHRTVIRIYLLIAGLYTLSASLIWGVNTLFLLDAGLDILEVFLANAVFTGSMALFEVPTGVVADTRGRRVSFLLSLVVMFLGTLGYVGVAATGGSFVLFLVMSAVLGLGFTFYSGAVEAWLVDALEATDFDADLDRVFARSSIVTGVAMLAGTIAGGLLGSLHLSLPFIVRSALLIIVFIIALVAMRDVGFSPQPVALSAIGGHMKRIAASSISLGWSDPSVRRLILVSAIPYTFIAWGFHAWQPYFLELYGDPKAVAVAGFIAAAVALAGIAGNTVVEFFTRYCGKRTTLMTWALIVQSLAAVGVGFAESFELAVGLYLVVMAPVRQAYLHQLIPSEQRATVISFDSMLGSATSMSGQAGLGYLSRMRSLADGYVVGGAVTMMALPVLLLLRRTKDEADVIRGRGSLLSGSACDGLPQGSQIDTGRRT